MADFSSSGYESGRRLKPHNATTVLVLGILGLVICTICGIIAWVMGRRDIAEMDAGIMDPAGRDTTRAGMICGMISCILAIVVLSLSLLFGLGGLCLNSR